MDHNLQSFLAFIFGCAIGSFLNVVRYRLPKKMNLVSGRSMCPSCGHTIAWYDNIPILSFLVLKRRCRWCGWEIPWMYFLIEVGTGVGFALIWHGFAPFEAVAYWVLASILIVCAGIDYDRGIIPDKLTLPGLILGLVLSLTLLRRGTPEAALAHSLLGIAAGGGTLFLISMAYRGVRGVEGMGGGDVKLMAMVGAFVGYKLALLTIFMASVAGALAGLFLIQRSSDGIRASVPFGVFLSPAAILCLLWGEVLLGVYAGLIS